MIYHESHGIQESRIICMITNLSEVKIQSSIFQSNSLLPLLFGITMTPLNYILRKCTRGYKFTLSQKTINHLTYMADIRIFANNEKEPETLIEMIKTYSQDIRMEFGIEKYPTLITKKGK